MGAKGRAGGSPVCREQTGVGCTVPRQRPPHILQPNENELDDLADWLEDHPTEADGVFAGSSKIGSLMWSRKDALHRRPDRVCRGLGDVIDDWVEILTAHDKSFLTTLQVTDAG